MERMIPVGKIPQKSAKDIDSSRLGLGFEKLDRDVFAPENAYDPVEKLGIKWVRLQSGWQRTEKEKGVYDFAWLDEIVDTFIRRGMEPWLCLCYGNEIYDDVAKEVFGAVACPPNRTEEQHRAWAAYTEAVVRHFHGRIRWYEIWNEPDWCWKPKASGVEYGQFAVETAKAIRNADPEAKIIGGCVCNRSLAFLTDALEQGMGEWVDAVTFHEYTPDETLVQERVRVLRSLCHMYNPNIEIIQGESGSQSRSGGHGALWMGAWTQKKQAKQLLRHAVADLLAGVKFSSYFSCVDMIEALKGKKGDLASYLDYGYFGVLGAEFDENGRGTGKYTPKPSYYALQNLASLLGGSDLRVTELPVVALPEESGRVLGQDVGIGALTTCGFQNDGGYAFAYWHPSDLMTTDYESTVTFECAALPEKLRLVDPMDGTIYSFPENMTEKTGLSSRKLLHIPVKDYPMFLTFGDF